MESLWPNTPTITSEVFADEVVIVNFESGTYYSVAGSGVQIWTAIERGATAEEVVSVLESRFENEPGQIESSVAGFLEQLEKEALVVKRAVAPPSADRAAMAASAERKPFPPPLLSAYTDMQELLWLDPVHEADEAGWPATRAQEPL